MRLNLIPNVSIQFRYLILIGVAMVVPAFVVGTFIYYFIFTFAAEQIGIPEAIAINLLPVVKKINLMLIAGLFPLFAVLLIWGLILTQRFCGPFQRIERDLTKILEGNYSIRFRVRKGDDLKGIVDKMNKIMDILQGKQSGSQ